MKNPNTENSQAYSLAYFQIFYQSIGRRVAEVPRSHARIYACVRVGIGLPLSFPTCSFDSIYALLTFFWGAWSGLIIWGIREKRLALVSDHFGLFGLFRVGFGREGSGI